MCWVRLEYIQFGSNNNNQTMRYRGDNLHFSSMCRLTLKYQKFKAKETKNPLNVGVENLLIFRTNSASPLQLLKWVIFQLYDHLCLKNWLLSDGGSLPTICLPIHSRCSLKPSTNFKKKSLS